MTELAPRGRILDAESDHLLHEQLDRPPSFSITDAIRAASTETGSGTSWLPGFWRCVNGPGKLTAAEYFYYGLYKERLEANELDRFVGKVAQQKMHRACCDEDDFVVARNKVSFATAMHAADVPVPDTHAIFDPRGTSDYLGVLTSRASLEAFLDDPVHYPIFAKPTDGMYSIGVLSMTDGGEGRAHVEGAGIVATSELARYMSELTDEGYLLQRMLFPADEIGDAFGGRLSTVRMLILLEETGPRVESAVLKIPRKANVADNYWRHGNMLGAIHLESGKLIRAVTGTYDDFRVVKEHPDTKSQLVGFQVPDWKRAVDVCKRAALSLPGLRTQSWDIALTNRGPIVIEVNWGGDLNLHQLAHGRGALSDGFVHHLMRNGYKGKLPSN